MTQRTIWGFEVETSPKGKNIWPYDLKRYALQKLPLFSTRPAKHTRFIGIANIDELDFACIFGPERTFSSSAAKGSF